MSNLSVDPGFGPEETVITTVAVDWRAQTMYQVGDVLRISGSLSSTFGKSWPRPFRWLLSLSARYSHELHDFLETAFYDLQESFETVFGYKFGPQKWVISSVQSSSELKLTK